MVQSTQNTNKAKIKPLPKFHINELIDIQVTYSRGLTTMVYAMNWWSLVRLPDTGEAQIAILRRCCNLNDG